ncbi:hypothetical protein CTA1_2255 [Colletotrichum tanaceti]|uniref:PiggyBac transposable element-derived protein domain-containing protein n=1 Tax=Colletotrichum tanaceti TaxID=1306861 RepID=A0A4U6XNS4_9PEZI|nr:hypothetical protein CTA1_2255 [Colletotrichum tanaceti]
MSRDRFQLLCQRLRIFDASGFDTSAPGPVDPMSATYRKVNEWSAHIQEAGESFFTTGSDLTVDKAMVRFTGRSRETTTIPIKPIPTGFKVWVLA